MKQINTMFNRSSKSVLTAIATFVLLIASQSCSDYLDVVPDDIATLDKAFTLRSQAEKYLFTCYSYLPKDGDVNFNLGMLSGDEMVTKIDHPYGIDNDAIQIALGNQNTSNPIQDVWNGSRLGAGSGNNYRLFNGIRECNVFLENVRDLSKVPDLSSTERERWIGEAEFLKAYYHFYLLRMYGPIPIIDTNVAIDASDSEINVKRQPVDDCVAYIVKTIDEATAKLPVSIANPVTEQGRITKTIALGIKAKVLLMAASPLFNGNSDMSSLKGKDGTALFNPTYDPNKWQKAADAALSAIQSAETNGNALYTFTGAPYPISATTTTQMSIRQAVCERWNPEIIWGNSNSLTTSGSNLQKLCLAPLSGGVVQSAVDALKIISVPFKMAEMFYSKNGVPIKEDKTLDFSDLKVLRRAVATGDEKFNIRAVKTTARINYDREPRFYADLGFDGGIWYKYDSPSTNDVNTWYLEGLFGKPAGSQDALRNNVTGYFVKKLVDWKSSIVGGVSYNPYPWPEMRLADLYLMYAEAKNEAGGSKEDVFKYVDMIRLRAGLDGVVNSWSTYSNNPDKPNTIDGRRAIIHQERNIELAFEGQRYWDLLRWKVASSELNKAVTGWNVNGSTNESYYQISTLFQQKFVSPRDYFWPIPQAALNQNPNLVQNIGW